MTATRHAQQCGIRFDYLHNAEIRGKEEDGFTWNFRENLVSCVRKFRITFLKRIAYRINLLHQFKEGEDNEQDEISA